MPPLYNPAGTINKLPRPRLRSPAVWILLQFLLPNAEIVPVFLLLSFPFLSSCFSLQIFIAPGNPCILMMSGSKAPTLMPADYSVLCTPTTLASFLFYYVCVLDSTVPSPRMARVNCTVHPHLNTAMLRCEMNRRNVVSCHTDKIH